MLSAGARVSIWQLCIIGMIPIMASVEQLWLLYSSGIKSSDFTFSLRLVVIFVCDSLKIVLSIVKLELGLILEDHCLLAFFGKKEGKTYTWSPFSEANWYWKQNYDLININLVWKLVCHKGVFCMARENRKITGCKTAGKLTRKSGCLLLPLWVMLRASGLCLLHKVFSFSPKFASSVNPRRA